MKTFTKQLIITALFTGTIFASSNDFVLLNDMKMVKELKVQDKKEFSKILDGLIDGDSNLNLRGTKISAIRVKLIEIKELLDSKSSSSKIDDKVNQAVELYTKSYDKYLQKQKLTTIVTQHMNQSKPNSQVLALYEKF